MQRITPVADHPSLKPVMLRPGRLIAAKGKLPLQSSGAAARRREGIHLIARNHSPIDLRVPRRSVPPIGETYFP
jgi:hypothetical protein